MHHVESNFDKVKIIVAYLFSHFNRCTNCWLHDYMQFFVCTVSVLYLALILKIVTLLPKRIEMYMLFVTVSKWIVQYNVV